MSLVLVGLLTLLFLSVAAWRLPWAILVVVACLPIYQLRFSIGPLPSTLLEVFIVIIFLRWLWSVVRERQLPHVIFPGKWLIVLLVVAATIGIVVAPDTRDALGVWKAFIIEPVLFYLVVVNVMKRESDQKNMLYCLGLSVIGLAVIALLQYVGAWPALEPWISESPKRVSSIFGYPNALGLFVAPVTGLMLGLLTLSRRRISLAFVTVVTIAGLVAIATSVSRGAVMGLAASILWLAIVGDYKRRIVIGLLILIGLMALLPASRRLAVSVITGSDTSTDVRLALWQGTWSLLKDRPIVGAGLAGFPVVYDQYRLARHTELLQYPHNIFLNVWVELGLLGLLVFLWGLGKFCWQAARLIRYGDRGSWPTQQVIGLSSGLIAMVVYGLVDVPFFKNDLAILFWIFMAMVVWTRQKFETTVY